jgi:hypothetical protein
MARGDYHRTAPETMRSNEQRLAAIDEQIALLFARWEALETRKLASPASE